jgi:hypothetical protein
VADRYRTAADVHDLRVDLPGVDAGERLDGEGLVEFDRADVPQPIPARSSARSAAVTGA